jgi:hypothetical protein
MGEDGMVGACMEPGESGDEWVWGPPIFWAIRILEWMDIFHGNVYEQIDKRLSRFFVVL